MLTQIRGGLVVSCQALVGEPLHGSLIMAKMALAAKQGGARGIRANSAADIHAIKQIVSLPVIGIVKRDYPVCDVYITPTRTEVDELADSGCDMVAMDATSRDRPGDGLRELVKYAKRRQLALMADISTVRDAVVAAELGFDCVSTTLYGYTDETKGHKLYDDDFDFLKKVLKHCQIPVIAEGNIISPAMYVRCMNIGAFACVVGGAITRPQLITQRFCNAYVAS